MAKAGGHMIFLASLVISLLLRFMLSWFPSIISKIRGFGTNCATLRSLWGSSPSWVGLCRIWGFRFLGFRKWLPIPRIRLFLWKVAWNRLPTWVLLSNRGMDIVVDCLICGLEEKFTEHAILFCPRIRLIWRMAGGQLWQVSTGSWPSPFLDAIFRSSTKGLSGT